MTNRGGWRSTTRARLRRRTSAIRLAQLGRQARAVVTINLGVLSALAILVLFGIRGPTVDLGFGGVAFTLALRAPRRSADQTAYDSAASRLVAANVVVLAAYVLLPTGSDIEGPLATSGRFALLWLAVPAAGVLVAEARARP